MDRAKFFLLMLITVVIFSSPVIGSEKLRIANSGDYPPYYYYDANGKLTGFDVDISMALCKTMGVECEIIVIPWDQIISGLINGQYDAIIASMAKTPEREKLVSFTDCYSRSSTSFIGPDGSISKISPETLKGKRVGAVKDSYQQEYLEKTYASIATIIGYENIEQTLEALVKGEVDLVLDDSLVLFHFLKSEKGKPFDLIGEPLPADDPSNFAYIAVKKNNDKLKTKFNEALKAIQLDGTFDKINRKYFPFSTY